MNRTMKRSGVLIALLLLLDANAGLENISSLVQIVPRSQRLSGEDSTLKAPTGIPPPANDNSVHQAMR